MNEAEQIDFNLWPAMWNQSASGVGSKIQLRKIRDNLTGSWQPGPNWALSVPTASKAPAGSSICPCKTEVTVALCLGAVSRKVSV